MEMGVLAVPDENSSRMTHGMSDVSYPPFSETRVLAVPDESSSRTIALYENTSRTMVRTRDVPVRRPV